MNDKVEKIKPEVKEEPKLSKEEEAIKALKAQLSKFRESAEYFRKMAFKAEGALEVLLEINPEEEPNEG